MRKFAYVCFAFGLVLGCCASSQAQCYSIDCQSQFQARTFIVDVPLQFVIQARPQVVQYAPVFAYGGGYEYGGGFRGGYEFGGGFRGGYSGPRSISFADRRGMRVAAEGANSFRISRGLLGRVNGVQSW